MTIKMSLWVSFVLFFKKLDLAPIIFLILYQSQLPNALFIIFLVAATALAVTPLDHLISARVDSEALPANTQKALPAHKRRSGKKIARKRSIPEQARLEAGAVISPRLAHKLWEEQLAESQKKPRALEGRKPPRSHKPTRKHS